MAGSHHYSSGSVPRLSGPPESLCFGRNGRTKVRSIGNGELKLGRGTLEHAPRGMLKSMRWQFAVLLSSLLSITPNASAANIRALLLQGDHPPGAVKPILDSTGMFQVDVAPPSFQPQFDKYKLVILNYAADGWPTEAIGALDKYLQSGGGLVVLPAGEPAFPDWAEFNLMQGVTAATNRDQRAGPVWFYKSGNIVFDDKASGPAGKLVPPAKPFLITIRNTEHPVTKGVPLTWLHAPDELAGNLRGPGKNMAILATAFSDAEKGTGHEGTGHDEPQILAITYGKGRVFHSIFGRTPSGEECAGYQTILQRGAEWAATGKVTQKIPSAFPTEERVATGVKIGAVR